MAKGRITTSVVGEKSPITRSDTSDSHTPKVVGGNGETTYTPRFRVVDVADWVTSGMSAEDAHALDDILWSLAGDASVTDERLGELSDRVFAWAQSAAPMVKRRQAVAA